MNRMLIIKICILCLCTAIIFFLIFFFANTKSNEASKNAVYCAEGLCKRGKKHIGCNNDGKISKKCAKTSNMIELTEDLKQLILKLHNSHRNEIAGGKIEGYEPATRMATMTWHKELAYLAELNVKTCEFEHDQCHNTKEFKSSGQNLGVRTNYPEIQPKEAIKGAIDDWFEEYTNANMNIIKNFQPNKNHKTQYGHFTAMVIDKNFKVGCGLLRTVQESKSPEGKIRHPVRYLFACNYATTNFINEPIYKSGNPASDCKTGKNPDYENLCSVKETYDYYKEK